MGGVKTRPHFFRRLFTLKTGHIVYDLFLFRLPVVYNFESAHPVLPFEGVHLFPEALSVHLVVIGPVWRSVAMWRRPVLPEFPTQSFTLGLLVDELLKELFFCTAHVGQFFLTILIGLALVLGRKGFFWCSFLGSERADGFVWLTLRYSHHICGDGLFVIRARDARALLLQYFSLEPAFGGIELVVDL